MSKPRPFYLKWVDAFQREDDYISNPDESPAVLEDVGWYLGRRKRGGHEYLDYCTEYSGNLGDPYRFCHSVPVQNVIEAYFLVKSRKKLVI